ncbi:MAG: ABC transporter ATP-binding protein [Bacteroidota bacterium]
MTKKTSIQVKHLSKSYKNNAAIDDISFDVGKGELFGVIGPDGAGKTTLFRIITSLILADKGEVKLNGLDVVKDYKKIRNIIGYMPGRFSLYQDLSVEENLSFFATVFDTTIEENYELIKDIYIQIEPFKKRLAGKLSGGMKQKLALSCALIHKPEILILDEPTTGVDAVSRKEFWEMLKILQKRGMTILVSTPYMDEASLCDRVVLMQGGKTMTIDTPENIINQFEKELFAIRANNLYKLIIDLRNYTNADSVFLFGQDVHYSGKTDDAREENILEYLTGKGHQNVRIKRIKANIEDCFMDLMIKE